MMGGKTPETCWTVNKRQDNKLKKLLHQVDDLFELNVKLRCQKVNKNCDKHFSLSISYPYFKKSDFFTLLLIDVMRLLGPSQREFVTIRPSGLPGTSASLCLPAVFLMQQLQTPKLINIVWSIGVSDTLYFSLITEGNNGRYALL